MFAQMLFLLLGLLASTAFARPPGLAFFPVNAPKGKTVQNLCRNWKAACQWVTGNVYSLGDPDDPADVTAKSGCTYIKGNTKQVQAFCHAKFTVPPDVDVLGVQELTVATARYLKTTVPAYTGPRKGVMGNPYFLYYPDAIGIPGRSAKSYLLAPSAGNVTIGRNRTLTVAYRTAAFTDNRFQSHTSAVDVYLVNKKAWGSYRIGTLKPTDTFVTTTIAGNFTVPPSMCGKAARMHLVEFAYLDQTPSGSSNVSNSQLAQTVKFDNGDVDIRLLC